MSESRLPAYMANRFRGFLPVIVDVETGGFDPQINPLLEIAAVPTYMDEEGWLRADEYVATQVKAFKGCEINPASLEVTGIEPDNPLRAARDERDALNHVFRSVRAAIKESGCSRAVLVGHNAHFDLSFLNATIHRTQHKRNPFHPFTCFDTATLAGLAYGQTVLSKAASEANIDFDSHQAHSAIYDAKQTAELFCTIVNRWKILSDDR